MDGVALPLRRYPHLPRLYVDDPDAVWCDGTWWPLTADAVALWTLRERHGERALCQQPAR